MRSSSTALSLIVLGLVVLAGCFGGGSRPSSGPVAAAYSFAPVSPRVGESVRFVDESTGPVVEHLWEFGDGEFARTEEAEHAFTAPGVFTVRLTVRGSQGDVDSLEKFVGVAGSDGAVPSFSVDFTFSAKGLAVAFEPRITPASSDVESYYWDFGDDSVSREPAPAHVYSEPGRYHVVLRAVANATMAEAQKDIAVGVEGALDALSSKSFAVIALVDTGINAYHDEFRDARFQQHPSTFIEGYPTDAEAIRLSLTASHYGKAVERDAEVWDDVKGTTLYWIPGTRIVGAISFDAMGPHRILDDHVDGHGSMIASIAAGSTLGACPTCLIVAVEGLGEAPLRWAMDQSWIDIVSNSWNYCFPLCEADASLVHPVLGLGGVDPEDTKAAVERGQTVLFASGNGVLNLFDVPQLTYWNSATGPDWIVTVGAADASSGATVVGTGRPVDVVSFGWDWEGASHTSLSSVSRCDGTSCSTPLVAGAMGLVLEGAREALGDTAEGPRGDGVIASGPSEAAGLLADGRLMQKELERAVFLTARVPNGLGPVVPTTVPGSPAQFLYAGYGLVDAGTAARALEVVLGNASAPSRVAEDQWAAIDSAIRNAIWDPLGEAAAGAGPNEAPSPEDLETWEELVAYFEVRRPPSDAHLA